MRRRLCWNAALRFDAECERLILAPKLPQLTLPGPLGNYHVRLPRRRPPVQAGCGARLPRVLRLTPPVPLCLAQRMLVRKVAKHYLLLCDPTPDDGVCLTKTEKSRPPPSRLQDVPVLSDTDTGRGSTADCGPPSDSGPPRVVMGVMRRNASSSSSLGGAGGGGGQGQAPPKTVEEREAEYERARERILGRSSDTEPSGGGAPEAGQPGQSRAGLEAWAAAPAPDQLPGDGGPGGPAPGEQQAAPRRGGGAKALLRDREKDLVDPDFVRAVPTQLGTAYVPLGPGLPPGMGVQWHPGGMPLMVPGPGGLYLPAGDFPPLPGGPRGWGGQPGYVGQAQQQQQQQQSQGRGQGQYW